MSGGGAAAGAGGAGSGRHRGARPGAGALRWPVLYARSRHVPISVAAAAVVVAAMTATARGLSGDGLDARLTALALAAAVAVLSIGLAGQDLALDRTAAIAWAPRRAAHLLLGGVLVAAMWLVPYAVAGESVPVAFVARDAAGFAGLAGLGAAAFGGRYAWGPPLIAATLSIFASPAAETPVERLVAWPVSPPDLAAATWTAALLLTAGTLCYALAGPRR